MLVGFGGLGHLAIQLLRESTSTHVTVVDTSEERLKWAREFGADGVAPWPGVARCGDPCHTTRS